MTAESSIVLKTLPQNSLEVKGPLPVDEAPWMLMKAALLLHVTSELAPLLPGRSNLSAGPPAPETDSKYSVVQKPT